MLILIHGQEKQFVGGLLTFAAGELCSTCLFYIVSCKKLTMNTELVKVVKMLVVKIIM